MTKEEPDFWWFNPRRRYGQAIFAKHSEYQKIVIRRHADIGLSLHLDDDIQSSELDEDIYHQALVDPAFKIKPDIGDVLVLGGGEGATAREVLKYPLVKKVRMIDIDLEVILACLELMPMFSQGAFYDPRLDLIIGDAEKFVGEYQSKYDLIIFDITDKWSDTPGEHLYSKRFFRKLASRLNRGGLLSVHFDVDREQRLNKIWSDFNIISRRTELIPSFLPWEWGFEVLAPNRRKVDPMDAGVVPDAVGMFKNAELF